MKTNLDILKSTVEKAKRNDFSNGMLSFSLEFFNELLNDISQFTPSTKEEKTGVEEVEERKFVYFIEDTHPAYKGLWFGLEAYPITSWENDFKAWTNDPLKAYPFKTYEEADKVRVELNMDGRIVTEHAFVNGMHIDKSQNCQHSTPLTEDNYEKEAEELYPYFTFRDEPIRTEKENSRIDELRKVHIR